MVSARDMVTATPRPGGGAVSARLIEAATPQFSESPSAATTGLQVRPGCCEAARAVVAARRPGVTATLV